VDHGAWYARTGRTDTAGALRGWVEREEQALRRGFSGLRLSGNTSWLERSGWSDFVEYEARVSGTFALRRIVALCSYALERCGADDVLDVVRHHDCALARRRGVWQVLASGETRSARQRLARENALLAHRFAERTAELEAALRTREEFLSVASHELRTPVAALQLAIASLLRAQQGRALAPADEQRRLHRAEEQCERLSRMVNDLLEVSRARTGPATVTPAAADLSSIVRAAAERLSAALARAECTLRLDAPAATPGRWDAARLHQVVTNLLLNAIRHAPGNAVEVTVTPRISGPILAVRDHGPGIPPEHRARIFDPFTKLEGARGRGGFGNGLWLVRRAVEAHGGVVELRETPGGGATFVVALPWDAAAGSQDVTEPGLAS
jgi:signal transduction histidine kinase